MKKNDKLILTIGALLHDIGKVVYRAGADSSNHSKSGGDFLANPSVNLTDKNILDMVKYHHAKELKNAKIADDSFAYIVYIADNIASGADRRNDDFGTGGFDKETPLKSIFNLLNNNNENLAYNPALTNVESDINFPSAEKFSFSSGVYKKILADIEVLLKALNWTEEYANSLLDALETNLSFVPSSTNKKEVADISLFNHVKLTAAFAAAIKDYLDEKNETDYKKRLFIEGKNFYDEKAFMLVTLDMSGIQNFIYTITSDNALKNLRARSFYLDFLTEHIADSLLRELNLTRASLIYAGGGRANLLLANTEKTAEILADFQRRINSWFQKKFDIALFLATGYAKASGNDLMDEPKGSYLKLYRDLSESISENKCQRYSPEEIIALNSKKIKNDTRECKICKSLDYVNDEGLCEICAALTNISSKIIRDDYEFIAVVPENSEINTENRLPLPENSFLTVGNIENARKIQGENVFLYGKNKFYTGLGVAAKFWMGDYHTGETFKELAKSETGIKRLGILRADIDNLGVAFAMGFKRENGDSKYVTISRTAELSRELSMFFKLHIKKILSNPKFTMTGAVKEKRRASIVYSGGDDLFIVGTWDDVIELAVDIRRNFAKFSQNTLTLSAGIGIYHDSYPISVMAEEVAALEDNSKKMPGKNAVTLPSDGGTYKVKDENGEDVALDEGSYRWDIFEEKVIGDKLALLINFFGNPTVNADEENERGKNFLYSILELLRGQNEKINLARYVYLLARMEPDKNQKEEAKEKYRIFRDKMYKWYLSNEDTRQLKTAILLYAYLTREGN